MNAVQLANLLNAEARATVFQPIAFNVIKVNEKIKITMMACDVIIIGARAIRLSEYSAAGILAAMAQIYPEFVNLLRIERLHYFAKANSIFD